MGKMGKKVLCIVMVIVVMLASVMLASVMINGAESSGSLSTMFVNDEPWYNESIYGWVKINSVVYVPVTVFTKFEGVEIKESKYLDNLMISMGSKYITIDTESKNFAYTDERDEFYMKTYYLRSDVLWVPVEPICEHFGFKYEINTKGNAIRVSDMNGSKTLDELLKKYNPVLADAVVTPTVTQESETTTTTTTTEEGEVLEEVPEVEEEIGERLIYITFEDIRGEDIEGVLDKLYEYGIKATFFLSGEEIIEKGESVRRMIAEGHGIGLHGNKGEEVEYAKDFNKLMEELERENEMLYKLVKQKTRIFRAPEGSAGEDFYITYREGEQLRKAGYIVWDWNVSIGEGEDTVMRVRSGIKRYKIPVIRIEGREEVIKDLGEVLEYIDEHKQFKVAVITPSSYEVNFIGLGKR